MQIRKKCLNIVETFFEKHCIRILFSNFFLVNPIKFFKSLYPNVRSICAIVEF
jgi:hypothetical protein